MEDITAQKKEIKLLWRANGLKTNLMALEDALTNLEIAILDTSKMGLEIILVSFIHLMVTFMMVLGIRMKDMDMEHSFLNPRLKLTLDFGKMGEFIRKIKKN